MGTWKGVEVLRECGLKKKAEAKVPPDSLALEGKGGAAGARYPTFFLTPLL